MIEPKKIRPGDQVTATFTVAKNGGGEWLVVISGKKTIEIYCDDIATYLPTGIQPGDEVKIRRTSESGKLIAVEGNYAWVQKNPEGGGVLQPFVTFKLADLERVE